MMRRAIVLAALAVCVCVCVDEAAEVGILDGVEDGTGNAWAHAVRQLQRTVANAKSHLEQEVAKNTKRSNENDAALAQLLVNQKKVIRSINANWVTAMLDCRQKLQKLRASKAALAQIDVNIKATNAQLAANDADIASAAALEAGHGKRLNAAEEKVIPHVAPKDKAGKELAKARKEAKASPQDKTKIGHLSTAQVVYNKAYAAWQEAKQAAEKVSLDKKDADAKAAAANASSRRLKDQLASEKAVQSKAKKELAAAVANRPHLGVHTVTLLEAEEGEAIGIRCTGSAMKCRADNLQAEARRFTKLAAEQASSGKASVESSYQARLSLQNRRHQDKMATLLQDLKLAGKMCLGNWA